MPLKGRKPRALFEKTYPKKVIPLITTNSTGKTKAIRQEIVGKVDTDVTAFFKRAQKRLTQKTIADLKGYLRHLLQFIEEVGEYTVDAMFEINPLVKKFLAHTKVQNLERLEKENPEEFWGKLEEYYFESKKSEAEQVMGKGDYLEVKAILALQKLIGLKKTIRNPRGRQLLRNAISSATELKKTENQ